MGFAMRDRLSWLQELDEAARRRLPKQLYIPLPCAAARRLMLDRALGAAAPEYAP
jgi:SpoVK/Ycf46/Vps4 family AAA+-type ATPase